MLIWGAALAALCGCGSNDKLPFLGQWKGQFAVDKIAGGGTDVDKNRETLRGFIQMYATSDLFKLHLEGEQEALDLDGTWSHKGDRVTLHFTKIKIDDEGGKVRRDPNRKFIPQTDLRAAYSHDLTLRLSRNKKLMIGLETSIGNLVGHHIFTRSED